MRRSPSSPAHTRLPEACIIWHLRLLLLLSERDEAGKEPRERENIQPTS